MIPAATGGVVGIIWGLVLLLVGWVICEDGQFPREESMPNKTSLALAGSLGMIAGAATLGRRRVFRYRSVTVSVAAAASQVGQTSRYF